MYEDLSSEIKELKNSIKKSNELAEKQLDLRSNFWRGALYGFGVFIGSAVLAALLIYLFSKIQVDGNTIFARFIRAIVNVVTSARH